MKWELHTATLRDKHIYFTLKVNCDVHSHFPEHKPGIALNVKKSSLAVKHLINKMQKEKEPNRDRKGTNLPDTEPIAKSIEKDGK